MSQTLVKRDPAGLRFPSLAKYFPDLKSWSVGFEREWEMLEEMQNAFSHSRPSYPPYNIKKVSDGKYEIELAVAGFNKNDLEVRESEGQIIVEGNKSSHTEKEDADYIHKGIASRHFHVSFALADHLEVKKADFKDGVLTISLMGEEPKIEKSHKIPIE